MQKVAAFCIIVLLSCSYCLASPPEGQRVLEELSAGREQTVEIEVDKRVSGGEAASKMESSSLLSPVSDIKEETVSEQTLYSLPLPTQEVEKQSAEGEALSEQISLLPLAHASSAVEAEAQTIEGKETLNEQTPSSLPSPVSDAEVAKGEIASKQVKPSLPLPTQEAGEQSAEGKALSEQISLLPLAHASSAVEAEAQTIKGKETLNEQTPSSLPSPVSDAGVAKGEIASKQVKPSLPPFSILKVQEQAVEEAVRFGSSLGRLFVTMGQSRLVITKEEVERVSITSPDIAEVVPISPRDVLVHGKKPGVTTIIIWDKKEKTYIYDLTVQRDVTLLKERLLQIGEGIKIEVHPAQDAVILFGEVDSPAKITKAIAVAASFFEDTELHVLAGPGGTIVGEGYRPKPLNFAATGGGTAAGKMGTLSFEEVTRVWNVGEGAIITTKNSKVISFLRLKDPLQVELQVRFSQIDLNLLKEYGFDTSFDAFRSADTNPGFVSGTTGVTLPTDPSATAFPPFGTGSGVIRYFLVHRSKHVLFQTQLRALEDRQVVKTLSEPNLTVISGQEATFLVGGEFPYIVPQRTFAGGVAGDITPFFTVEWKVFGNKLELVPEVKETGMINLKLTPEVSERSEELGVDFPAFGQLVRIPGLATRRTETTVEMQDGESLVIAGLVSEKEKTIRTQVPFFGDIPVLGALFRKTGQKKDRTELMIVVTPRLVKPMSPKEAERVTKSGLFRGETVYRKFLEKRFEPSKSLVGPFGYQ